jgi:hypothetical protein
MASSKYAVCTDLKAKTFQLTMLKLGANLLSQSSAWWYSGFFFPVLRHRPPMAG